MQLPGHHLQEATIPQEKVGIIEECVRNCEVSDPLKPFTLRLLQFTFAPEPVSASQLAISGAGSRSEAHSSGTGETKSVTH